MKRFVICSFPQPISVDPDFAEKTWATLREAIIEINRRNTTQLSFEQLYRYAYNLVLHKHGEYLYQGLIKLQTEHLKTVAQTIIQIDSANFLSEIHRQWRWFSLSLNHTRDVLMYMDRYYVKSNKKQTVEDLGLSKFRDVVIYDPTIYKRLSETLLACIDRERNGEVIDTLLIRSITRMLALLGDGLCSASVYEEIFEDGFLTRTKEFYAREAVQYISQATCADYLRKANQRIQEEVARVDACLESPTKAKVRSVTEYELISKYMAKLVDMEKTGLISMIRNDKISDLRLMYTLFKGIENGDRMLRSQLKKEVLAKGMAIVNDLEYIRDPVTLINAVLELKEKFDHIVTNAFATSPSQHESSRIDLHKNGKNSGVANSTRRESLFSVPNTKTITTGSFPVSYDLVSNQSGLKTAGAAGSSGLAGQRSSSEPLPITNSEGTVLVPDKSFISAVNESFERFINSFQRSAEYISLYLDKLLRKDFRTCSDEEVETKLNSVMTLFRFLNEKDVFERYYKLHLTKRLLNVKSASTDAERCFISKIKTECGYLYTSKMEVMFNDIKTSNEAALDFQKHVDYEKIDMQGIDLHASILTTMSWPLSPQEAVVVPEKIKLSTNVFEEFYNKQHSGRCLTWQWSLGTGELRARFGGGSRVVELVSVSAYSVFILLLFNEIDSMTYEEIAEATKIPEQELIRHLQSLSLGKHRVLIKQPCEKNVNRTDRFSFNDNFTSRSRRVKMQVISAQRETENERNQTRNRVDDDRRPIIETFIVRIMKHRKILEHNKLLAEVTNQLASRFEPDPQEIKRRIESLVDRDFIKRQPGNMQMYQYIA